MRRVIVHSESASGYWAECPSLAGCMAQGETLDEVVANIKDAIELWIDAALDDGEPIPPEEILEFEELELLV